MQVGNTLAYYDMVKITVVQFFIVLARGQKSDRHTKNEMGWGDKEIQFFCKNLKKIFRSKSAEIQPLNSEFTPELIKEFYFNFNW